MTSLQSKIPAPPASKVTPPAVKAVTLESAKKAKTTLAEALVVLPKPYVLKTESLSGDTKELHTKIYKEYADSFNAVSTKLDVVSREDANNPHNSVYRNLKMNETENLNGVKLHELYFSNISDPQSEIRVDSIPFMRLSRDWGTFENWQFDFRACGLVANEGWVVCYYEPFKQRYMNVVIEGDTLNVPLCCIPVIVVDTHHHAWFLDYAGDKTSYLNAMMKELHWSVVEARMSVAEHANLQNLYAIQPVVNAEPEKMIGLAANNQAPIGKDQIANDKSLTANLSSGGRMNSAIPTMPSVAEVNPRSV